MSMPIAKIYCDRCEFVIGTNVGWGKFSYTLSEGRHLSIDRGLGWCNDCESLTPIESFAKPTRLNEELEQLDSRIASLQPKGIFSKLLWNQSQSKREVVSLREQRTEIAERLAFLSRRMAPPKCLECGSTAILEIQFPPSDIRPAKVGWSHPNCGGELWIVDPEVRLSIKLKQRHYSAEGDVISTD